jgi:hypothetical protein
MKCIINIFNDTKLKNYLISLLCYYFLNNISNLKLKINLIIILIPIISTIR